MTIHNSHNTTDNALTRCSSSSRSNTSSATGGDHSGFTRGDHSFVPTAPLEQQGRGRGRAGEISTAHTASTALLPSSNATVAVQGPTQQLLANQGAAGLSAAPCDVPAQRLQVNAIAAASTSSNAVPSLVLQSSLLPGMSAMQPPAPQPSRPLITNGHLSHVTHITSTQANSSSAAGGRIILPPPPPPPPPTATTPATTLLPLAPIAIAPSIALEAQVHNSIPATGGAANNASNLSSASSSSSSLVVGGNVVVSNGSSNIMNNNSNAMDLWTPEIFRNRRLRSGKWIKAEEIYADALIELFEKGLASDCTSGCTLRAYLSKKLHCAPMRISKKYAGRGIGKMAFVPASAMDNSNKSSTSPNGSGSTTEAEIRLQEEQVQRKAEEFYVAVFQCRELHGMPLGFLFGGGGETIPPTTAPNGLLAPSLTPGLLASDTATATTKDGLMGITQGHHNLHNNPFGMSNGTTFPGLNLTGVHKNSNVGLTSMPIVHATATNTTGGATSALSALPALSSTAALLNGGIQVQAGTSTLLPTPIAAAQVSHSATVDSQTLQLQQTYLNAILQQQQPIVLNPGAAMVSALSALALPAANSSTGASTSLQRTGTTNGTSLPLPWQAHGQKSLQQQQPNHVTIAPNPMLAAGAPVSSPPPHDHLSSDPVKDLASPQAPDFLTGFDRVALSLKPMKGTGSGNADSTTTDDDHLHHPRLISGVYCSPTYTSRSFDDFHRFLGQDLSTLDSPFRLNNNTSTTTIGQSAPPFPVHDMNGSNYKTVLQQMQQQPAATNLPHASTVAGNTGGNNGAASGNHKLLEARTNNAPDTSALFSAEAYAMFASAAVAASSQHAAYLPTGNSGGGGRHGAMIGLPHPSAPAHHATSSHGVGIGGGHSGTRSRADTFDIESTVNLVSAHVGKLQKQPRRPSHAAMEASTRERTRTYHCSAVTVPQTRETLLERMYGPRLANLVSGSEPSTSSAAETESGQGSMPSSASSSGVASESEGAAHTDHSLSEGDSSSGGDHSCDSESESVMVQKCKKIRRSCSGSEGVKLPSGI